MDKKGIDQVRKKYERNIPILEQICEDLKKEVEETLKNVSNIDRITFRVKSIDRFMEKVEKKKDDYSDPLVNIEDQIGGRVIVFFPDDIDIVKEQLEKTFYSLEGQMVEKPEDERTHKPKDDAFGYQSFHCIFKFPPQFNSIVDKYKGEFPQTFEMQIRTIFMHAYAEPQHKLVYESYEDLPKDVRKSLAWIAASAWGADQEYQRVIDWADSKE